MGCKRISGLHRRDGAGYIGKQIRDTHIGESSGDSELVKVEESRHGVVTGRRGIR